MLLFCMYWVIYSININSTFSFLFFLMWLLETYIYVACILFLLNSASLDGKCNENSEQGKVAMIEVISETFLEKDIVSRNTPVRGRNCRGREHQN